MNQIPDTVFFPFGESDHLSRTYALYIKAKREGFAYKIQAFSDLWKCWMAFDEAWEAGLESLQREIPSQSRAGGLLFMVAHARCRVAIDIAFSGCLPEARSIMRDAIEFVAHAHRLSLEPQLVELWKNKAKRKREWEEVFWHKKKENLFLGLDVLYRRWKFYSDLGSHANIDAISSCLARVNGSSDVVEYAYLMPAGDELFDKSLIVLVHDVVRSYQVFVSDWLVASSDETFIAAHAQANSALNLLNSR